MKKIVVKIGSSVLAPGGELDAQLVAKLARDICFLHKQGHQVVLVSSGAIACGITAAGLKRKPTDMHMLMALSSLGQILLMDAYASKFKRHKVTCAQILLTWEDFDNRKRFLNARHTIYTLLEMGVVPIINENDAVTFEEIKFGDNDRLSVMVADVVDAEMLVILSNVDGLLDGDTVVPQVSCIDAQIKQLAKKEDHAFTFGGMAAKLEAVRQAMTSGRKTVIANGRERDVISRIANGEAIGTLFAPAGKVERAKKRWIAFSAKPKGVLYIDCGAKEALLNQGKSLLGVGIVKVEGSFKAKDAVEIRSEKGDLLGCGLSAYSSQEVKKGKRKRFPKPVVHRDNFSQGMCGA